MSDAPETAWLYYEKETDDTQWVGGPETDGLDGYVSFGIYIRAEAAEKALAEVTAERDEQKRDAMKWFGIALENKHRAEAAEARIATIERETLERAAVVAEAWYYATVGDGTPHEEIRAMIEEKTDE